MLPNLPNFANFLGLSLLMYIRCKLTQFQSGDALDAPMGCTGRKESVEEDAASKILLLLLPSLMHRVAVKVIFVHFKCELCG